jgi:hypothetical protein
MCLGINSISNAYWMINLNQIVVQFETNNMLCYIYVDHKYIHIP